MPSNPASFRPSKELLVTKEQRELALARRRSGQNRTLAELPVGAQVSVQNQSGNRPKRWDRTGTIVETLPDQQYKVRMDGSGDISLRNWRF